MGGIIKDLRFALRQFRLNPTFTIVSVLSLALGIGANAVYNICAAVIVGQQLVKAGAYTDVVTVTLAAGA